MISFYPGPSRVYEEVPDFVREAYDQGLLSINHRSKTFMKICEETITLIKSKLGIPEDYAVVFTSSATECWEIIAQSLTDIYSYHFYNGAFGKKWFDYTKRIKPHAVGHLFNQEEVLETGEIDLSVETGVICITQNETSNGTHVDGSVLNQIRIKYPHHLIAIDATSSMAGMELNFAAGDVWFASVQKCFGLPAGMAVMICSPKAIERSQELQENAHYNSLNFILENFSRFQTPYTPNVLNIYLLKRMMEEVKGIHKVHTTLIKRREQYEEIIEKSESFSFLIRNKKVRSDTVLVVKGAPDDIGRIKQDAEKAGILLGNGYGPYKETTFRIANFPALKKEEVKKLRRFLTSKIKLP